MLLYLSAILFRKGKRRRQQKLKGKWIYKNFAYDGCALDPTMLKKKEVTEKKQDQKSNKSAPSNLKLMILQFLVRKPWISINGTELIMDLRSFTSIDARFFNIITASTHYLALLRMLVHLPLRSHPCHMLRGRCQKPLYGL